MSLTKDDVSKIAHLARLNVADDELNKLTGDLDNILKLVAEMDSADTSNVAPLAHAYDAVQPLRDDVVTETNQRDHFQSIAPSTHMGLYIVPKVIEGGE